LLSQGPIDVRSSRPPVKEDGADRDKRRQSAEKQKSVKDSEKKKEKTKILDRQALEARQGKSRQRGEPEEESPDEEDGGDGDGDDSSDDSEGMASRLDRILAGPPRADADVPRTGAPKEGPGGSLERQQRESSRPPLPCRCPSRTGSKLIRPAPPTSPWTKGGRPGQAPGVGAVDP